MIKTFKMKLYPGMEEEYERRHNKAVARRCIDMIHAHGGRQLHHRAGPGHADAVRLHRDRRPRAVGRRRRHRHQPEVVGLHGRHHGDQRGQLACLDGLARALPFGLACRGKWPKEGGSRSSRATPKQPRSRFGAVFPSRALSLFGATR